MYRLLNKTKRTKNKKKYFEMVDNEVLPSIDMNNNVCGNSICGNQSDQKMMVTGETSTSGDDNNRIYPSIDPNIDYSKAIESSEEIQNKPCPSPISPRAETEIGEAPKVSAAHSGDYDRRKSPYEKDESIRDIEELVYDGKGEASLTTITRPPSGERHEFQAQKGQISSLTQNINFGASPQLDKEESNQNVNGEQERLSCPPRVDEEFFYSLPTDMQQEIVDDFHHYLERCYCEERTKQDARISNPDTNLDGYDDSSSKWLSSGAGFESIQDITDNDDVFSVIQEQRSQKCESQNCKQTKADQSHHHNSFSSSSSKTFSSSASSNLWLSGYDSILELDEEDFVPLPQTTSRET